MTDEEYLQLARLIGERLGELGLDEIADFGNYLDDESEERSLPEGKVLIKRILGAFDRYLAANGAETVAGSLALIRESIDDGRAPERAFLHFDDERSASLAGREAAQSISTLGKLAEVRAELKRLEALLLEDSGPLEPGTGAS